MGRDKATLAHPDSPTTMVEHTVEVLRARCSPVLVIAAPGQALPPLQAEVLSDEIRGVGPLLGVGARWRCSKAVSVRIDWTRFAHIGDADRTGRADIDLATLGLQVAF